MRSKAPQIGRSSSRDGLLDGGKKAEEVERARWVAQLSRRGEDSSLQAEIYRKQQQRKITADKRQRGTERVVELHRLAKIGDARGLSSLLCSVSSTSVFLKMLQQLVYIPDPSSAITGKRAALHTAAEHNQVSAVEWLVQHGSLVEQEEEDMGNSAAVVAAEGGKVHALALLVSYGADIDHESACTGGSARRVARGHEEEGQEGDEEVLLALIKGSLVLQFAAVLTVFLRDIFQTSHPGSNSSGGCCGSSGGRLIAPAATAAKEEQEGGGLPSRLSCLHHVACLVTAYAGPVTSEHGAAVCRLFEQFQALGAAGNEAEGGEEKRYARSHLQTLHRMVSDDEYDFPIDPYFSNGGPPDEGDEWEGDWWEGDEGDEGEKVVSEGEEEQTVEEWLASRPVPPGWRTQTSLGASSGGGEGGESRAVVVRAELEEDDFWAQQSRTDRRWAHAARQAAPPPPWAGVRGGGEGGLEGRLLASAQRMLDSLTPASTNPLAAALLSMTGGQPPSDSLSAAPSVSVGLGDKGVAAAAVGKGAMGAMGRDRGVGVGAGPLPMLASGQQAALSLEEIGLRMGQVDFGIPSSPFKDKEHEVVAPVVPTLLPTQRDRERRQAAATLSRFCGRVARRREATLELLMAQWRAVEAGILKEEEQQRQRDGEEGQWAFERVDEDIALLWVVTELDRRVTRHVEKRLRPFMKAWKAYHEDHTTGLSAAKRLATHGPAQALSTAKLQAAFEASHGPPPRLRLLPKGQDTEFLIKRCSKRFHKAKQRAKAKQQQQQQAAEQQSAEEGGTCLETGIATGD